MSNIDSASLSPRIENGKLMWYEFDTFAIEFTINLLSTETSEPITIEPDDKMMISFYKNNIPIHKFCYENFSNGDSFLLEFTENVSNKFKAGDYYYTVTYFGDNRTTIVSKNKVEVEK